MKQTMLALFLATVPVWGWANEGETTGLETNEKVASIPVVKSNQVATEGQGGEISTAAAKPDEGKVFGLLDIRPSISTKTGVLGSENTIEGGYQFNPNLRLTYTQWWNTTKNLSEGVYTHDGFFRLRVNNIYKSDTLSVNYQARLFLPTYSARREAGYLTGVYNQLLVSIPLSPTYTFSVATAPTFQHFSKNSHNGKVNSLFQNTAVANLDIQISKRLMLSVPIYLISTKARTVAGLAGSGEWSHLLVLWPEAAYSINDTHTVGLSLYTDNLMTPTLSKFTLDSGLSNSVLQAFWTVRI
jgi:hypothetical protein